MEIWKDITQLNGNYSISNLGNVKSKRGRLMKLGFDKYGYIRITLCQNGKKRPYYVHRLVCLEFLLNPENKPLVNHKNGKRSDNRVENLEWSTHQENVIHGFKNGRIPATAKGEKAPHHILKERDIPNIRKLLQEGEKSMREIGNIYGVGLQTIYSIKSGKNWKHIL